MEFVKAINYEEDYRANSGVVCYGDGSAPGKSNLKGHYLKGTRAKDIGKISELNPRYYYLMKLLNVTIAPKAGNLGEVSGHVIQLLMMARLDEERMNVMQWMYETMKHVVKSRRSLCYGPYVYAFVKHVRAVNELVPLEELFPPNVQHRAYAPKTK